MPTVPTIGGRMVAPTGLPNARVNEGAPAEAFGAGLARPLQAAAGMFADIQRQERDKADTAAVLEADNGLDAWETSNLLDPQKGALFTKGKDAFDLPNRVLPEFDKESERLASGLTSERAKLAFQQRRQQRRTFIAQKLNQHEANEREGYYDAQDAASLATSRNTAANYFNDPERIALELGKQEAVIDGTASRKGLPAERVAEAKRAARSDTHVGVIDRYLAMGEYKAGQSYFEEVRDQVGGDDATRIEAALTAERRRAEVAAKQAQSEARQILQERVRDATAAYRLGLDFDAPPSRADFVAALGADDGNKEFANFQREQQLGSDLRALAVMSPEEQGAMLAERAPTGTAGVAETAERFRILTGQAEALQRQRDADPAAYAARYSPRVAAAFSASQASPQAAASYASATIAEQKRLGVAQPKILPDALASSIAQSFYTQNGENVAAMIQQEKQRWGSHWPQVFGELAAKKMPAAALAIGRGMEPGAAIRLASVAAVPMDELKKGLDVPPADLRTEIDSAMEDFRLSLGGVIGAENTFSGMYESVERLAYGYLRQGMDLNDATEQAYTEVLGEHYAFHTINDRKFRVPREYDTPGIQRGAERALESINAADLQAPFAMSSSTPEQAAADLKRVIGKRGYWVTSADGEKGLALFLDGYPVLRKDGKPYEIAFDALATETARRRTDIQQRIDQQIEAQRERGP